MLERLKYLDSSNQNFIQGREPLSSAKSQLTKMIDTRAWYVWHPCKHPTMLSNHVTKATAKATTSLYHIVATEPIE